MIQNDNVTNALMHGLVNDHGFEDTTISRVKQLLLLLYYKYNYKQLS